MRLRPHGAYLARRCHHGYFMAAGIGLARTHVAHGVRRPFGMYQVAFIFGGRRGNALHLDWSNENCALAAPRTRLARSCKLMHTAGTGSRKQCGKAGTSLRSICADMATANGCPAAHITALTILLDIAPLTDTFGKALTMCRDPSTKSGCHGLHAEKV